MTGPSLILIAWIAGSVLTLALLSGTWWALFADRSRGQHRCPRCWHLMDPTIGLRCPECGRTAPHERDLLRTRRHWPAAAACLLLLFAGTFWLRSVIAAKGWWHVIPHRAALALMPWVPSANHLSAVRQHLLEELQNQRVSPEDTVRMLETVKSGGLGITPGSDAWRSTYLRWISSLEDRYANPAAGPDDPLRLASLDLPPVVHLAVPEKWHRDQPLMGTTVVDDWWASGVEVVMRITSIDGLPVDADVRDRLLRLRWSRPDRQSLDGPRDAFAIELGRLPEGVHQGEVTLEWETRDHLGTAGRRSQGTIRLPVKVVVEGDAPPMAAVDSPELQELVSRVFSEGLLRTNSAPPRYAFSYAPFETSGEAWEDLAFGLVVEACERGTPRRTLRVWWRGGLNRAQFGWDSPTEDREALDRLGDGTGWTLRVRGDAELARRAAGGGTAQEATRWWCGAVEKPLSVQDVRPSGFGSSWRATLAPPSGSPRVSR